MGGYEALVRGIDGESAAAVLAQVNESNRYAFDRACHIRAIELVGGLLPKRVPVRFSVASELGSSRRSGREDHSEFMRGYGKLDLDPCLRQRAVRGGPNALLCGTTGGLRGWTGGGIVRPAAASPL